jgi:hypothetical protein
VPSLDLRFADNKSLTDAVTGASLVTFTRASSGTFVDSAGVLQTAATDVPRFDHNPTTGESLGLLVEEQRTNSIRNNTMVGAVAGTPGTVPTNWAITSTGNGLTREILGTGAENGITYIDVKISGTTTANVLFQVIPEPSTGVAALTAQTWTTSAYLSVAGGSLPGSLDWTWLERDSGGSLVTSSTVSLGSPTTAALRIQRYSNTRLLSGGASVAFVQFRIDRLIASGTTVDFTLRIGLPQLEQGAFATSVIPTSTTAVTRSADVASDTTRGGNIRSLFAQFRSPASGTRPVVSLDDNTANERIEILTSGTDPKLLVTDGGSAVADIDAGAITANTTARIGARFNTDNFAASISGGAEALDATGTMPTVDRIRVGSNQAGGYLNGTIARITGWDTSLPNLPTVTQ